MYVPIPVLYLYREAYCANHKNTRRECVSILTVTYTHILHTHDGDHDGQIKFFPDRSLNHVEGKNMYAPRLKSVVKRGLRCCGSGGGGGCTDVPRRHIFKSRT